MGSAPCGPAPRLYNRPTHISMDSLPCSHKLSLSLPPSQTLIHKQAQYQLTCNTNTQLHCSNDLLFVFQLQDRISKRGRKLVDYDHSLHQLESLQTAKKRDDEKIAKVRKGQKCPAASKNSSLSPKPQMSSLNILIAVMMHSNPQAEEDLNEAKHVYEAINTELKEDLPSLHER